MGADGAAPSESTRVEIEGLSENDIADSLGMNLEPSIESLKDAGAGDAVEITIEPEIEQFGPAGLNSTDSGTPGIDQQMEAASSAPVSIPPDQVEAALENVIRKMFGPRIDTVIIEAIEKAVRSDIEKIKKELIRGASEDS